MSSVYITPNRLPHELTTFSFQLLRINEMLAIARRGGLLERVICTSFLIVFTARNVGDVRITSSTLYPYDHRPFESPNHVETSAGATLLTNFTRRILFVHVGKSGGETIKQVLAAGCSVMRNAKRRKDCLTGLPNSVISDQVEGYFHCFSVQPRNMEANATSFLFNLRHPVDRVISWYKYVHPHNCHPDVDSGSPACSTQVRKMQFRSSFPHSFTFRSVKSSRIPAG